MSKYVSKSEEIEGKSDSGPTMLTVFDDEEVGENKKVESRLSWNGDDTYHDSSNIKYEEENKIAAKENREVRLVKHVIFLVLVMSTIGAIAVYFYTWFSEEKQFEDQFYDDAHKV